MPVAIEIVSYSPDGSSELKTFWKWLTIVDAMKNICDSWEEIQVRWTGIQKKLIPALMDDLEGSRSLVEEVTADMVEIARPRISNKTWRCNWIAAISW